MKIVKNLTLILALTMVLSLVGCSGANTSNVATFGDSSVPAGVYIYYMMNNTYKAATLVLDKTKSPLKQDVEGKKGSEWVAEKTKEDLLAYAAAETEAKRLNLTVDKETEGAIAGSINDSWEKNKSYYEKNGVSKESIMLGLMNQQKRSLVLTAYYGEGGEKTVPDDETKKYFEENYARISHFAVSKVKLEGTERVPLSGDALMKAKEDANNYFNMLKEGKPFNDVLYAKDKAEAIAEGSPEPTAPDNKDEFAHDFVVSLEQPNLPEKFTSQTFATKVGEPGIYEDDSTYVVFIRKDVSANPEDYTLRKPQLAMYSRTENFNTELAELSKTLDVKINEAAISKYQPKNIKDN